VVIPSELRDVHISKYMNRGFGQRQFAFDSRALLTIFDRNPTSNGIVRAYKERFKS
jgi:hypothetical protein